METGLPKALTKRPRKHVDASQELASVHQGRWQALRVYAVTEESEEVPMSVGGMSGKDVKSYWYRCGSS